ncbi:MAG: hypothetical protein AB8B85_10525 [Paracoccaceae bacterium]
MFVYGLRRALEAVALGKVAGQIFGDGRLPVTFVELIGIGGSRPVGFLVCLHGWCESKFAYALAELFVQRDL